MREGRASVVSVIMMRGHVWAYRCCVWAFARACTSACVYRMPPPQLTLAQAIATRSDLRKIRGVYHVHQAMSDVIVIRTARLLQQVFDAALGRDIEEQLVGSAVQAVREGCHGEWYADIQYDGWLHTIELAELAAPYEGQWLFDFNTVQVAPELSSFYEFGLRP